MPTDSSPEAGLLLYRTILMGSWDALQARPHSNMFRLRKPKGETGLSVFRGDRCSEEQVLASAPPGAGLVALIWEEVRSCLDLIDAPNAELPAPLDRAHAELVWRQPPAGKIEPGQGKLRLLAQLSGLGTLRIPDNRPESFT